MQDIRLDELLLDVREHILKAHPDYKISFTQCKGIAFYRIGRIRPVNKQLLFEIVSDVLIQTGKYCVHDVALSLYQYSIKTERFKTK